MVKGMKLLGTRAQAERCVLSELENVVGEVHISDPKEHENMTSGEKWEQFDLIDENVAFRRLGFLAHGI